MTSLDWEADALLHEGQKLIDVRTLAAAQVVFTMLISQAVGSELGLEAVGQRLKPDRGAGVPGRGAR